MFGLRKFLRDNKGFLLFMGLMFIFRSALADWNYVPSSSMNPTLYAGDRVLVDKRAYGLRVPFTLMEIARWSEPQKGDVITFDSPEDGRNLIKRVVAVGGDTVGMWNNTLTINGHAIPRKLVQEQRFIPTEYGVLNEQIWQEQLGELQIEVACLPNGFIDVRRITGRAVRVVMSHDPDAYYIPRSNRWWQPLHL